MSQNESTQSSGSGEEQPQNSGREVARRVFARELEDATFTFKESDDERAPVYLLLPTGEKANRLFIAGTLTEVNDVGSEDEYLQARIVGPTGTFFAYAGKYQPEAASFLRQAQTPCYVAMTGKPRTYDSDDGETLVSLRPEQINEVDEATRTKWVLETADQTIDRIEADEPSDQCNQLVNEHYPNVDLPAYKEAVITAIQSTMDAESESEGEQINPEIVDETQPSAEAGSGVK